VQDQYEDMLKENAIVRLREALKAIERNEYNIAAIMFTEISSWFNTLYQYKNTKPI
jgi:3-methyladenine DNA glycosylase Tag